MTDAQVPPPPPPPPPRRTIKGLGCASCGGAIDVEEGLTTLVCRYCGTPQAVVGHRGTRRMMVLDKVNRIDAIRTIKKWFGKGVRKEPGLVNGARIEEIFLAWFPFIRVRCDVVGWFLGVDERRVKRGNKWETKTIPIERQVAESVDNTIPAADMSEFGVSRVNLAGDEIIPLDEDRLRGRGMVFRPNRGSDEAAAGLVSGALERIKAKASPDKTYFSWLSTLRRRIDLIFYPLWVVRYVFKDRVYQVLVDAEDGTIAFGKAPGNHLWRAFSLISSCAGACFLGTTILQHAGVLLRSKDGLIMLGVIAVILAGFVHWGFRQFRSGGVVEEGTGLAADGSGSAMESFDDLTQMLGLN